MFLQINTKKCYDLLWNNIFESKTLLLALVSDMEILFKGWFLGFRSSSFRSTFLIRFELFKMIFRGQIANFNKIIFLLALKFCNYSAHLRLKLIFIVLGDITFSQKIFQWKITWINFHCELNFFKCIWDIIRF